MTLINYPHTARPSDLPEGGLGRFWVNPRNDRCLILRAKDDVGLLPIRQTVRLYDAVMVQILPCFA